MTWGLIFQKGYQKFPKYLMLYIFKIYSLSTFWIKKNFYGQINRLKMAAV